MLGPFSTLLLSSPPPLLLSFPRLSFSFETESYSITQTGFTLITILLPQSFMSGVINMCRRTPHTRFPNRLFSSSNGDVFGGNTGPRKDPLSNTHVHCCMAKCTGREAGGVRY